jgi:hypothetical protein
MTNIAMTLEEAIMTVITGYEVHMGAAIESDEALAVVKAHFRRTEGFQFDGDDALGAVAPEFGDSVVFVPIADNPPADRPRFGAPVAGKIKAVMGEHDVSHFPPGFPYMIELDDAKLSSKRTIVYANRDEVQIVSKHLASR